MDHTGLRTCFQKLFLVVAVAVALSNSLLTGPCIAQRRDEMMVEDGPLIDQRPFDLIHLTDEAGSGEFKVMLLPFPGQVVAKDPPPAEKIQVVLMKFPERKYEIAWKSIAKIELFEDVDGAKGANKARGKGLYRPVSKIFSFMMRAYPAYPRLKELRQDFLVDTMFDDEFPRRAVRASVLALEELRHVAPTFREKDVMAAMNRIYEDSRGRRKAIWLQRKLF